MGEKKVLVTIFRRNVKPSLSRKSAGFTLVEILIVLIVSSILVTMIYQTMFKQSDVLTSGSTDTRLQSKIRTIMLEFERSFKKAGDDPCRTYYWDDHYEDQQGVYFAPTHPYGTGTIMQGLPANPFQAMIMHWDPQTGGETGEATCTSDAYQVQDQISGELVWAPTYGVVYFINGLYQFGSTAEAFLYCPNYPRNTLLRYEITQSTNPPNPANGYNNPLPGYTLDCNRARSVAEDVECVYFDYLFSPNDEGDCSPGVSDSPPCFEPGTCDPSINIGPLCRISGAGPGAYGSIVALRKVNRIRVHVTVKADKLEKGYSNDYQLSYCNMDNVLPTGKDLTGIPYRTLSQTKVFDLSALKFRE